MPLSLESNNKNVSNNVILFSNVARNKLSIKKIFKFTKSVNFTKINYTKMPETNKQKNYYIIAWKKKKKSGYNNKYAPSWAQ